MGITVKIFQGEKVSTSRRNLLRSSTSVASSEKQVTISDKRRTSPLRNVRNLIRFGKQRPPKSSSDNNSETTSLIYAAEQDKGAADDGPTAWESESAPVSRAGSHSSIGSNNEDQLSVMDAERNRRVAR
ncbi:hypothetical protein HHI36_019823 [Cryptolaemus montrouzieri]|uniref:Uncharacterized protein n=1 Tax=Cryptolaemus montrouzieri TaxID=559131 RepID=A0ABD2N9Z9_9CUCU